MKELLPLLPGHAPWGAQADAALAAVALARGDDRRPPSWPAARPSRPSRPGSTRTSAWRSSSRRPGPCSPAAPPEVQGFVRGFLQQTLSRIAQGTADEKIRVRVAHRAGRARARRAGRPDGRCRAAAAAGGRVRGAGQPSLDETERRLLQLLTEGRTNAEIAAELDLPEDDVAQRLARLLARLGTSSRAEATSLAFRGLAAVGSR